MIWEGSPSLVTWMKDCVDIIRKEVYDSFISIFEIYEDISSTCTILDIDDSEFKKEVLDVTHDSGWFCQISALHLVQTYLIYSKEDIEDFDQILNLLVIKLATTIINSEVYLSLQALDVLDAILLKFESKVKSDAKWVIKKLIFHWDPRVSKRVMQILSKQYLHISPLDKEQS